MPIRIDNDKDIDFVRNQVLYLAGAFPNLKWDINISTGSWITTLTGILASKEELQTACEEIVVNGYKDWEVNLSLITKIIKENRQKAKQKMETQKFFIELEKAERNKATYEYIHNAIENWKKEQNET